MAGRPWTTRRHAAWPAPWRPRSARLAGRAPAGRGRGGGVQARTRPPRRHGRGGGGRAAPPYWAAGRVGTPSEVKAAVYSGRRQGAGDHDGDAAAPAGSTRPGPRTRPMPCAGHLPAVGGSPVPRRRDPAGMQPRSRIARFAPSGDSPHVFERAFRQEKRRRFRSAGRAGRRVAPAAR